MFNTPLGQPARVVRIFCPVEPATLLALRAGDGARATSDKILAAMLDIIRAANPLGDFGAYRGVAEISLGLETFIPGPGTRPVRGEWGEVSLSPTVILTTYIADDAPEAEVTAALGELIAIHPWEVPIIEITPTVLLRRP